MAFSDLCHIGNAYKSIENEPDQSERIMEENSMVRDLITKILDESGPTEGGSSLKPPEKAPITGPNQYQKPDGFNQQYNYHMYNYPTQNDQPGLNYNLQNGFTNGFNYDAPLMGVDTVDSTDVSPEQLNLLRLAAQEIGGAQFTNPKFENYNFFNQPRNTNAEMFPNFPNNRPNSLNMEMGINTNFENPYNTQRFPQNTRENQENGELLTYLNQLQVSDVPNSNPNLEFKMADMKYPGDDFKMQDPKAFYNRNFPPKTFNGDPNYFMNDMAQMVERPPPNYEFHQGPMNFKPNGFHQNEFMQRRDMPANHQRETYPSNGTIPDQRTFENGQNIQQAALMRQNQELARQMNMLMRSRPPPNQLNVDVSFLHDNPNFNLGVGALLGASPPMPPSVLPSPMLDLPLLAPFYTMRNMRGAATASGILHARLDACYEQWRQLERERKRTEARLALAYPGRAVSSSNSIPVPRLPPCPTRVDRLTIDMLREHTKVLTLMGKMETLRASVCVAQNKKPNKEDPKITVLKRGQENIADKEKHGLDPNTFDPSTWREDIGHLAEIAPHSEVETAMLAWRNAVGLVQLARRRELQNTPRYPPADPILQLAEAVKQLCVCARRARCAMWSDLTLTVALAPLAKAGTEKTQKESTQLSNSTQASSKPAQDNTAKQDAKDSKEKDKPSSDPKPDTKQQSPENNNNLKTMNKNEKTDKRRPQNYRKVNGRNDFYQKNQRYDNRFMQNRHPYYLATGPIN